MTMRQNFTICACDNGNKVLIQLDVTRLGSEVQRFYWTEETLHLAGCRRGDKHAPARGTEACPRNLRGPVDSTVFHDANMPRGGARAAGALAKKVATAHTPSSAHHSKHHLADHVHHEPHYPDGVDPGAWKHQVHKFRENKLQMVNDPDLVSGWSEVDVAAWIACISNNKFEIYSDLFLQNHINGPVLMQMQEYHLDEIGVDRLSDQIKMWEIIDQMQRRCKKPETQELKVPAWPVCAWQQITFAWANTSEGKGGAEMCEEVATANGSIALVSTLVWGMAWDLFFGSATVCYCPTDVNGVWGVSDIDYCFCSTAWDMDKWPLALFYLFAGVSTLMFMMSTIFAVIQILMVYEMSDEAEIEQLMDLIASEAQLPGQLLFLGLINFCVPVALYLVYTINLGIGDGGKIFPGPKYPVQQIMAWLAGGTFLFFTLVGHLVQMPMLVGAVYEAKVRAVKDDATELYPDGHHGVKENIHVGMHGHRSQLIPAKSG